MQKYKLIESKSNLCPFAIFANAGQFWQQVSKWYFYKGAALRRLRQLQQNNA